MEAGYLAEASLLLKLSPGKNSLAILPGNLGLLVQGPQGVRHLPPLTGLQAKLLRVLSGAREAGKQDLVEGAWGYAYAPLRHDGMVYAALSALRKALGEGGDWIHPTENGYRLEAEVSWAREKETEAPRAAPVIPALASRFNHRQIEILDWIRQSRFLSVNECRKRFGVSEVTAQRDMDGLMREGIVIRIGKARATRYGLAKGDAP